MVTQSYNDILTKMKNLMIANQDKLTDFNEGSIILTQFEVIANILERFYVDTRNGYTQSLKDIAYSIFDFKKKAGAKATTNVVFQDLLHLQLNLIFQLEQKFQMEHISL